MSLERIAAALERLAAVAEAILLPVPSSAPGSIAYLGERHLEFGETRMDIQQFAVSVPEHPTPDVNSREVTVEIPADVVLPADVPHQQTRLVPGRGQDVTAQGLVETRDIATDGAFEVPQDVSFELRIVAVDDSGNRADPSVQQLTAEDLTKPAPSGEATVVALGERHVPDGSTTA